MALYQSELIKVLQFLERYLNKDASICMLGVQKILIDWISFEKTMKRIGITYDVEKMASVVEKRKINTFDFFEALEYKNVHAIDISDYEGADILYDLNKELPDDCCSFDFVMNIGTLEHIFDVTNGMKNIMKLTKIGGYILNICPAAGYVDHGFYSFSPTFFEDFYKVNYCKLNDIFFEFIDDKSDYAKWHSYYSEDCRIFDTWEGEDGVQIYVDKIKTLNNIGRVQLWSVAKKEKEISCNTNLIQRIYRDGEQRDI